VKIIDGSPGSGITIISRKYDGTISRSWKCSLLEKEGDLLSFLGVFEDEVSHPDLGIIRRGTTSLEFYWLDRWYNIFRFHEPDGELRNYYCNINLPPKFENDVLDYVDLDIDVVVWRDLRYEILDMEDFQRNSKEYDYPLVVRQKAEESISELISMIEGRKFPFDHLG
jgi:protein associated with RNAse G/E